MKINHWSGKNVFITGINGFIGGNLCKKLINDSNTKIIWKIKHREFDLLGGGGYSDNTKTIKNLNWKPKISLEAGLQMSHKWYKMNHGLYKNN